MTRPPPAPGPPVPWKEEGLGGGAVLCTERSAHRLGRAAPPLLTGHCSWGRCPNFQPQLL